jgi:SAM-dependent methyltransferase
MSQKAWNEAYSQPQTNLWTGQPSWFAKFIRAYLPACGQVLDLGAGPGQDSRFFAGLGYKVVSTDFSEAALRLNTSLIPANLKSKISLQQLDITRDFPFADACFEVVYAHLCLHYFNMDTTHRIISEISRVLKTGGIFAFMVNSTGDTEYGQGPFIEEDYYLVGKYTKRYFNTTTAGKLVTGFETIVLDNYGEAFWQSRKGVHNLIRFVGRKTGEINNTLIPTFSHQREKGLTL